MQCSGLGGEYMNQVTPAHHCDMLEHLDCHCVPLESHIYEVEVVLLDKS